MHEILPRSDCEYTKVTDRIDSTAPGDHAPERLTAWVSGRVQGVGFRWWTRSRALELGLVGWARNTADGRVEVVAEGDRESLDRLVEALRGPSAPGSVREVAVNYSGPKNDISGFRER
jgi:acylphosphatase